MPFKTWVLFDEAQMKQLSSVFEKGSTDLMKGINQVLFQSGNDMRNSIINSMQKEQKHGLEYIRGKKTHIASAPGEAPAVDTGALLRSIQFDLNDGALTVGVVGVPYGEYLELGATFKTRKGQILPRPFIAPAIEKNLPMLQVRLGQVLLKNIGGNS